MLDHLSAETTPIPDVVWETASSTSLPAADALTLGMSAYRAHRVQTAAALWSRVAGSNHPDAAPTAAFNLGLLEQERGDVPAARAAWQVVIDSGHPEHAPGAAFNLDPPISPPSASQSVDRGLVDAAIQRGWVADVTIMSASEIVSTEFWPGESVKDLDVAGAGCAASGAEHSPSPGAGPSRTSSCGGRGPRGP